MVGIINDSLSLEAQEADTGISQIACNYKQYLDFEDTRYEMFYVYYVIPDNYKDVLIQLRQFRNKHFPGIRFSVIYVYNTLVFFFPAMQLDLSSIYHFLDTLSLNQPVSIEYRHESYPNLQELLKELIQMCIRDRRKRKRHFIIDAFMRGPVQYQAPEIYNLTFFFGPFIVLGIPAQLSLSLIHISKDGTLIINGNIDKLDCITKGQMCIRDRPRSL